MKNRRLRIFLGRAFFILIFSEKREGKQLNQKEKKHILIF